MSDQSRPTIVLIYKTLGPYHAPRLRHLARKVAPYANVLCIAIASGQNDYLWKPVLEATAPELGTLRVITLFPEETLENITTVSQIRALVQVLRSVQTRLILTAGYAHLPMVLSSLILRKTGARSVVMFDSNRFDSPRKGIFESMKRFVLSSFDGALIAGTNSRNYLTDLGMSPFRMELACDVVDNDSIASQVASVRMERQPPPCFLFVGRFIEKKNLPLLLSAYQCYRSRCRAGTALPLVLCGSGPVEKDIRKLVDNSYIECIEFAGYIDHPEIYEYYQRARALILPSTQEQWGLVVNEALASGVPVLASDACGCVPELVRDGATGWAFPSGETDALAKAMQKIHTLNAAQLDDMRAQCVATVQEFGLPRFTDGIERLAGRLAGLGPYASTPVKASIHNQP